MTKQPRLIAATKKPKPLLNPREEAELREAWLALPKKETK
jgi:hypothetical protein